MDYTRANVLRLFDEVLRALNNHAAENGAVEALEYLKASKYNYEQGDLDRMLLSLILALQQFPRLSPGATEEIRNIVAEFTGLRWQTAKKKMSELAEEYQAQGGKLMSLTEILEEVGRRRGSSG
jgi:hypothetical protein